MRWLTLPLLLAAALAGCGNDDPTPSAAKNGQLAELVVRVDDDGARGGDAPRELRLSCAKPTDSSACGAAAEVSEADLQKNPGDMACTQVYGGPEEATITGMLRGAAVDASFKRTDGCQIARWNGVKDLLAEVH